MDWSNEELEKILEYGLCVPPAKAGLRIKSEPALAKMLGINRMRVRALLDGLVERGVLARRHGSGTYLRKLPSRTDCLPEGIDPGRAQVVLDRGIFAQLAPASLRRRARSDQRRLNFGLVADENFRADSPRNSYRAIYDGLAQRAQESGHDLLMIGLEQEDFDPEGVASLKQQFQDAALDGCVVRANEADWFEAVREEFDMPVVFISDTYPVDHLEPRICMDPEDAERRALAKFIEAGYRRIGFIGFQGRYLAPGLLVTYERALAGADIHERWIELLSLDEAEVWDGMVRMFRPERGHAPEAVYVSDDILLHYVVKVWEKLHIVPGRDVAVITMSSRSNPLPSGISWSHMEFNPRQFGRMAMDSLLQSIQNVERELCSFTHQAAWHPGTTHTLRLSSQ